jgi:hypothetical protein
VTKETRTGAEAQKTPKANKSQQRKRKKKQRKMKRKRNHPQNRGALCVGGDAYSKH